MGNIRLQLDKNCPAQPGMLIPGVRTIQGPRWYRLNYIRHFEKLENLKERKEAKEWVFLKVALGDWMSNYDLLWAYREN